MAKPKHLYPLPYGVDDPDQALDSAPAGIRAKVEAEIRATRAASPAQFDHWRRALGGARAASLLYECWTQRRITLRTLRKHVGSVWHTSDIPDYWLDHDQWRELFDAAGFTHVHYGDYAHSFGMNYELGSPAEPPTAPITVYRGAIPERRDDWSWTANPQAAAVWAKGDQVNRPAGRVWTTTAPPVHVLCRIDRWDQYVIDTRGLTITEHKENPS